MTFTGNPKWPEITNALQGRQDYLNRPDIVCRVFMDKANEFIKDLVEKNVLGKVAGFCYSVEHQKRGNNIKRFNFNVIFRNATYSYVVNIRGGSTHH